LPEREEAVAGWRLLLATLIGEVDMKGILILVLAAAPFAIAGCGGNKNQEQQTPAVEEVRPTTTTPPPAVMPPETTMMRPESMPSQTMPGQTMPSDTSGMQNY
jgi:hypothetical protein